MEVHQVNPAYSSVIGRVKFMERYGLSVHQAAALVLARRLLGCSERVPRRRECPVGNGVHVTFAVPARKRVKHVWTYWGAISGQLRPALAAQHRLGKRGRGSIEPGWNGLVSSFQSMRSATIIRLIRMNWVRWFVLAVFVVGIVFLP